MWRSCDHVLKELYEIVRSAAPVSSFTILQFFSIGFAEKVDMTFFICCMTSLDYVFDYVTSPD